MVIKRTAAPIPTPFGVTLKHWRTTRRLSQLALASRAGTPPRHVSFLETGRARPSQDMVLRLAHALDVPLAERNRMLTAAGFAPAYAERPLTDVALAEVRFVLDRLLHAHEPYPALVLDAWYTVLEANGAAQQLLPPPMPGEPVERPNLIELLLGPYQQIIVNWREVLRDTQQRMQHEASTRTGDARFLDLLQRVDSAAGPFEAGALPRTESPVLLTQLRTPEGVINTLSTFVYFGSARDVTVEGMHVELMYPADAAADRYFRR